MRAILFLPVLFLAACESQSVGGDDFVQIPREGPKRAASAEEAARRATAWCKAHDHRRAEPADDGDGRYYTFACH